MDSITFYRGQFNVIYNEATGEYLRPVLQLCYVKPLSIPPYAEYGITDIVLADHPEIQQLIEQATALAVPIAISKILNNT